MIPPYEIKKIENGRKKVMGEIIQQLINGLSMGSIYALIALGYTMVYGILKLINFAHGEIYMIGAFASYYSFQRLFFINLASKFKVNLQFATDYFDKVDILKTNPSIASAFVTKNSSSFGLTQEQTLNNTMVVEVINKQVHSLELFKNYISTHSVIIFISILVIAMVVTALFGIILEKLAYKPLRNSSRISVLLTALGVSMFLQNGGIKLFGAGKAFPQLIEKKAYMIGDAIIFNHQIIIMVVAFVLMIVLTIIVKYTKTGKAMRAVAFDGVAAKLMGIDINRTISFTFAIGSALAAAAGVLVGMTFGKIDPLMGMMPGIKAFVAAVLGGIGSIPGAVIGGLIMGISESVVVGFVSSTYKDAIAFGILILILIIKPSGLFGSNVKEKV